ncbi:MAG: adenosylmethionine decarboxylase [Fimbriimonadales bacterium]|nr:adenosylmethionine decarboxylase [Fimbriimonadales bacterium]
MTYALFLSCFAVAALAMPWDESRSWWRRLFGRRKPVQAVAAPVVQREGGWTTIQCDDPEAFAKWLGGDEDGFPLGPDGEMSLGSHLLIELFGCDRKSLETESTVGRAMRQAADVSQATVVAESFHEFRPFGVSGAVIIQESHYTIHTWPEHRYAAVDLFYCGGTVKVHRAVELLRERFRPQRMKFLVVRRGLESEVAR